MRILVTGASGFVGHAVCRNLVAAGHRVDATFRAGMLPFPVRRVPIGRIDGNTDWGVALDGVDMICHLASPAHQAYSDAEQVQATFRAVNVAGTKRLAAAASKAGARRIVFVSTIKVNGEATAGRPFSEDDRPAPEDVYGRTKLEAEDELMRLHAAGQIEAVILRPPLICGPGVKGNLRRLLRLCNLGVPLPLGGLTNRRSLIGVDNLADAVRACLEAPQAAGHRFLISDDPPLSTTELIHLIGKGLARPVRLLHAPTRTMRALARLIGAGETAERLLGSLEVDSREIRKTLRWNSSIPLEQAVLEMAHWYRTTNGGETPQRFALRPSVPPAGHGDVSVAMVSYYTGPALREATQRVLAARRVRELIVVDNGNDPDSTTYLDRLAGDPRVVLLRGQGNVGYAQGCNIAAQCASERYLLILNPDCMLEPNTLDRLVAMFEGREDDWVATVCLVNSDGSEQLGCRRNLGSPGQWLVEVLGLYRLWPNRFGGRRINLNGSGSGLAQCQAVPAISGAFMFMPRDTYCAMGGLDPAYFLHFEDLDFCMRLSGRGVPIYFVPSLQCVHIKGTSKATASALARYKARGMRTYFRRYFSEGLRKPAAAIVWLTLATGLVIRGAVLDLARQYMPRWRAARR